MCVFGIGVIGSVYVRLEKASQVVYMCVWKSSVQYVCMCFKGVTDSGSVCLDKASKIAHECV